MFALFCTSAVFILSTSVCVCMIQIISLISDERCIVYKKISFHMLGGWLCKGKLLTVDQFRGVSRETRFACCFEERSKTTT